MSARKAWFIVALVLAALLLVGCTPGPAGRSSQYCRAVGGQLVLVSDNARVLTSWVPACADSVTVRYQP